MAKRQPSLRSLSINVKINFRHVAIFVLRITSGPNVKFVDRKKSLSSPVVYAADRSKAVVLFCVALWFIVRGVSCLVLFCSLSSCFLRPFSIVITSFLEEGAVLCAPHAFVCLFFTR